MTTNWRALCAELVAWADNASARYYSPPEALIRARAALATDGPAVPEGREPASVVGEPSDEELQALADQFWVENSVNFEEEHYAFARAVLARWGHQPAPPAEGEQRHPTPVPVAERLPGPEDCDAGGRCWFFIDGAQWAIDGAHWALEDRTYGCNRHRSHWLPAHALPLPAGEVELNAE